MRTNNNTSTKPATNATSLQGLVEATVKATGKGKAKGDKPKAQASAQAPVTAAVAATTAPNPSEAHVCTMGRRGGKVWYGKGSVGYNIALVFAAQPAGATPKQCKQAAIEAGFSAGSVASCWADYACHNTSLVAAGLPTLGAAYSISKAGTAVYAAWVAKHDSQAAAAALPAPVAQA